MLVSAGEEVAVIRPDTVDVTAVVDGTLGTEAVTELLGICPPPVWLSVLTQASNRRLMATPVTSERFILTSLQQALNA
jgi:hypothetical protein